MPVILSESAQASELERDADTESDGGSWRLGPESDPGPPGSVASLSLGLGTGKLEDVAVEPSDGARRRAMTRARAGPEDTGVNSRARPPSWPSESRLASPADLEASQLGPGQTVRFDPSCDGRPRPDSGSGSPGLRLT
jgi:hypothetical protein